MWCYNLRSPIQLSAVVLMSLWCCSLHRDKLSVVTFIHHSLQKYVKKQNPSPTLLALPSVRTIRAQHFLLSRQSVQSEPITSCSPVSPYNPSPTLLALPSVRTIRAQHFLLSRQSVQSEPITSCFPVSPYNPTPTLLALPSVSTV